MRDLSRRNLTCAATPPGGGQGDQGRELTTNELWGLPVNERPRDKILEAFRLERFLTIPQVAGLFYSVRRDGQPARSTRIRPRKDDAYDLVPGYHSARDMLNRMVDSGQLVVFRNRGDDTTPSLPNLYALKGTRKPIND